MTAINRNDVTAIGLGTSIMANPTAPDSTSSSWSGSYVYFGSYSDTSSSDDTVTPTKYRVLSKKTKAFGGTTTMLLDSDSVLWSGTNADGVSSACQSWSAENSLKTYLNGDFLTKCFDAIEQSAIAKSVKASAESGDNTDKETTANLKYTALSGEKVFLLDAAETMRADYGYSNSDSSAANREKSGAKSIWRLRSDRLTADSGGCAVLSNGDIIVDTDNDETYGVSPAMNIDLSKVLFSSVISGTAGKAETEYKLTLLDESLEAALSSGSSIAKTSSGNKLLVPYTISGTDAANATNISLIVLSDEYTAGNTNRAKLLSYETVSLSSASAGVLGSTGNGNATGNSGNESGNLDSSVKSGTAIFSNPTIDAKYSDSAKYYIVAEDINYAKETDYASTPTAVTISDSLATAYKITATDATLVVNTDGSSSGTYIVLSDDSSDKAVAYGYFTQGFSITVTANSAPSGKKFASWVDSETSSGSSTDESHSTLSNKITISSGSAVTASPMTFTVKNSDASMNPVYEHEHSWATTWSSDGEGHWYACTSADTAGCDGTVISGKKVNGELITGKAKHVESDWIIDKAATTEAAGVRHKECTTCDYTTATETIPQMVYAPSVSYISTGGATESVSDIVISLSTKTDGATIYYTTDGSTPSVAESTGENGVVTYTTNGTTQKYDGSITITGTAGTKKTTIINAIAVKSGMTESNESSFTYSVSTPHNHTYSSDVTYEWSGLTTDSDSMVSSNGTVTCTATRKCTWTGADGTESCSATESETVAVTPTVTRKADCTNTELSKLTATFTNSAFTTQTKENVETSQALGHIYAKDYTVDKLATCTEDGSKSKHCARIGCTSTTDTQTISATGHNYKYSKITYKWQQATASGNDGTTATVWSCTASRLCSNCGYEDSETVSETNASSVAKVTKTVAKQATCTTPELSKYTALFDNKDFGTATQENIESSPALGHDFAEKFTVDEEPTCAAYGTKSRHCTREGCDAVTDVTQIEKKAHTYGDVSYDWSSDYKSCIAMRTCSVCGYIDIEKANTANKTVTSEITREADCIHTQLTTYTAKFSNTAFTTQVKEDVESSATIGHSFGDATYTWNDDYSQCTATRICSICGYKDSEIAEGDAITSEITQKSDCTTPQLTTYTAAFESESFETQTAEDIQTAEALGHTSSDWVTVTEATAITTGLRQKTCTVCGRVLETETIAATGTTESTTESTEATTESEVTSYEIISGANSKWKSTSKNMLVIAGDGDLEKLVGVYVDGVLVDSSNYLAKEGSTIIKLRAKYLSTLSTGSHTFEIKWSDGSATTNFTITGKTSAVKASTTKNKASKTGDVTSEVWVLMLLMASGVVGASEIKNRRKY